MDKPLKIEWLLNRQINTVKWDKCVSKSVNGMVYGFSWYLDIVHDDWEALVTPDYSYVMPLTQGKKYGIDYLFQPIFTQQLGVFSLHKITPEIVAQFLHAIPPKYRFAEIKINTFNLYTGNKLQIIQNTTYQLDLVLPYSMHFKNYSKNTKRNIKKAYASKLSISEGLTPNEFVAFFKTHVGDKKLTYKTEEYNKLRKLISSSLHFNLGKTYGVYSSKNELVSIGFITETHQKSIFLISASSNEGKELRANFFLTDKYIKKKSEHNLVLDFEGSNIEGIARFYAGFGAKPYSYQMVKFNRLPLLARILKK